MPDSMKPASGLTAEVKRAALGGYAMGDHADFEITLASVIDTFDPHFNISTP